eukprot:TRINITY_DN74113_c0_g1_i1.p1 TRINITY_DN74113_c0_g1~~TRINITY_DN74113_c0_g1_i1.p1  ORF type:complete len:365 (-),score=61.74 TRINITY_DN74113_c0_g1_i1:119-1213(-)
MAGECESIFVGSLPGTFDDSQLMSVFGAYGTITSSKLLPPGSYGTRAAIISYTTVAEAKFMVENVNGNIPEGLDSPVEVRFKGPSANKGMDKGMGKGMDASAWAPAWPGKGFGKDKGKGFAAGPDTTNKTIFIGNLPGDMTEQMLHSIFGAYGTIVGSKLMDPNSLGFRGAVVELSTVQEAKWLVENLDGNLPEGLTGTESIKVNFKQQSYGKAGDKGCGGFGGPYDGGKGDKGCGKGGKGSCSIKTLVDGLMSSGAMPGGTQYSNDQNALFVGGLPPDTTNLDLFWIFSPFGPIAPKGVTAMPSECKTYCKGIGFVNFLEHRSCEQAIATLNGTQMPDGTVLTVSIKRDGGKGGKDKGGKGKW